MTLFNLKLAKNTLYTGRRTGSAKGFLAVRGVLVLMIATSLLPIGLMQFHASVSEGLWWARSEAFMQQPILVTLRWVRTFGDVVFIVGALAMAWQVVLGVFQRDAAQAPHGRLQSATS